MTFSCFESDILSTGLNDTHRKKEGWSCYQTKCLGKLFPRLLSILQAHSSPLQIIYSSSKLSKIPHAPLFYEQDI